MRDIQFSGDMRWPSLVGFRQIEVTASRPQVHSNQAFTINSSCFCGDRDIAANHREEQIEKHRFRFVKLIVYQIYQPLRKQITKTCQEEEAMDVVGEVVVAVAVEAVVVAVEVEEVAEDSAAAEGEAAAVVVVVVDDSVVVVEAEAAEEEAEEE